jgi:hypothetical protein
MNLTKVSIYIPRMDNYHTIETITQVLYRNCIGIITHVDFTPIYKEPGFYENINSSVKSAFVHFADHSLQNCECWNTIYNKNKPFYIEVSKDEYWICFKNNNPVQRTMMNIHQIVENGRYLEKLIEEQSKMIKKLEYKVEKMNNVINNKNISGMTIITSSSEEVMTDIDEDEEEKVIYNYNEEENFKNNINTIDNRIQNSYDLCGNN